MKNLAIIIPVYNQLFYTKQLIQSIKKERENCKEVENLIVFIVNNASTDETSSYLESLEYKSSQSNLILSYFNCTDNLGYGGGSNVGIKLVGEKYEDCDFLVLNNDMLILPNCIDELVKTAYSREDIGIVGAKLLFPDGLIQHGGAFLNVFGWGQHIGAGQRDDLYLDINEPKEMEYCTGACLYIKQEVVKKVGLFDERFEKGYFEEVDYSYRARQRGYKTFYCPAAKLIHYENVTSKDVVGGNSEDVKKKISDVNQIKFYLKREEEDQGWKVTNTEVLPDSNVKDTVSTHTSDHKLLITSQIYGEWSFTMVMRNLAKGLKRNGVDVSIAPVEYHYEKQNMPDWEIKEMIQKPNDYWNRVVLRSCEGDHMYLMPPGKQRIAHTTGESTRINKDWVLQLNNVDKVLTTSTFFRNVMLESGVKKSIYVLPNTVNLDYFKREGNKLPINGLKSLNFVSMFHFGERKAPDILIKAFCKAFSGNDDVTLTIHALSMKHILEQEKLTIGQWIDNITGKKFDKPTILVTTNFLEDRLIPDFLRNFDVFVLPTRGEGFGLPALEAGALGIPSIVTGYSGITDIVDDSSGWLIDYKLTDIPLQYLPYFQNYIGGKWAEPDEDHLVEIFRQLYNNRESIKEKSKRAWEKAQQYSVENVGKLAKDLIFEE